MKNKKEFNQTTSFRLKFISMLAALAGSAAAILAYLIYHFIGFLYNFFFYQRIGFSFIEPPTSGSPWWIIVVPALGGLICGLLAKYGSSQIVGHGIPEAMEAVWKNKSKVKLKLLFLKPVSAAIAIGTGAPFGVEGPIIQGGGALGSGIGQWLSTTATERKVLLACGAAAGMAATFNTPLAAILIAIELLVFEFKTRSFIPISIASLFATGVRRLILGTGPMFKMESIPVDFFANLPFLIVLGIIIGFVAILFNKGYFKTERFLHRTPLNDVLLPSLGGLILGVMGYLVPRTFGVGYSVGQEILNNQITWEMVLLVMLFKIGGVYITLGTKTSGGFLAPVFIAGAAVGSLYAQGVNALIPGVSLPISLFALAGLGTLFGVVCSATFGFTLFAIEATGHFDALLPVFLVALVADIVTSLYMRSNIMTTELVQRGVDVSQDYEINMLQRFSCEEVMDKNSVTFAPDVTIAQLATFISKSEESNGNAKVELENFETMYNLSEDISDLENRNKGKNIHAGFPIVNSDGKLLGLITYSDIVKALANGKGNSPIISIANANLIKGYPDEKLYDLVVRMGKNRIEQLSIVSRDNDNRLIGLLNLQNLIATSLQKIEEEEEQEPGWFSYYINMLPSRRRR